MWRKPVLEVKKPIYRRWWFWVIAVIVVAGIVGAEEAGEAIASSDMPKGQASLVAIVAAAQKDSEKIDNDMQRGGIKAKRDQALCQSVGSTAVTDWIGQVREIGANSDGKGVLAIAISKRITVKTWNNDFSDLMHHTLMQPGSPLFNTASGLKVGQKVKFSGTFFKGVSGDCLYESSLRLQSKVEDPEFIFRFSSITPM